MRCCLQNGYFPSNPLDICFFCNPFPDEYFNRNVFLDFLVECQFDFTEGSLAECLSYMPGKHIPMS